MPTCTQSRTLVSHDKNTGRGGHDPNKSWQDKGIQVARAEGDPHCRVSSVKLGGVGVGLESKKECGKLN